MDNETTLPPYHGMFNVEQIFADEDQSYLNFNATLHSRLFKKYPSWARGRLLTIEDVHFSIASSIIHFIVH